MVSTIDQAFVEEYNADVHLTFRQMGSRLINMSRKGSVRGSTVRWQVFGAVAAQSKTRNAAHTFADIEHTYVQATMVDYYVPTLVDDLDLLKLNIDEKGSHVKSHVAAMGKKADTVLINTMYAGANASALGDATSAFDYGIAMDVLTTFQMNEVPDDGGRFCALHPYAWAQMLQISEFANADYVGSDRLPFAGGMTAKHWMGVTWFPEANLYLGDGAGGATAPTGADDTVNVANNLCWHKSVLGHGVNAEPKTIIDYENTYSAYSFVTSMSLGAEVIEDTGVYIVKSLSAAPA